MIAMASIGAVALKARVRSMVIAALMRVATFASSVAPACNTQSCDGSTFGGFAGANVTVLVATVQGTGEVPGVRVPELSSTNCSTEAPGNETPGATLMMLSMLNVRGPNFGGAKEIGRASCRERA